MRTLIADDIPAWVEEHLLAPDRTRPIVAVTSHPRASRGWIDAEEVQRALGDLADVVFLETGDTTWALSEALPPRLDVYGGAMRVWWPALTRESDPYDHRLYFAYSLDEAHRALRKLVADVRERMGAASQSAPVEPRVQRKRDGAVEPELDSEPIEVRVVAVRDGRVHLESAEGSGLVQDADLPLELLAQAVVPGAVLTARATRKYSDGTTAFSVAGFLPSPWARLAAEVEPGDVVTGRVQNVQSKQGLVFVDVLPGVVGVCHVAELDYERVDRIETHIPPGTLAEFVVLAIDAADMALTLSRKRAYGHTARPSPSLVPGGQPFVWRGDSPWYDNLRRQRGRSGDGQWRLQVRLSSSIAAPPAPVVKSTLSDRVESLEAELHAANEERANLVDQLRQARLQLQAARKALRSAEDRHEAARKGLGMDDPLASERAFLLAVRMAHARMFDEGDRLDHPLQRMRLGPEFLASVRGTEGVEIDKVVEVCAQVASGVAHTIAARQVHQLRSGPAGTLGRVRELDGAQAWRCALQVNTPSARRLHWWNVPREDGATIEFASVDVHDGFGIPD